MKYLEKLATLKVFSKKDVDSLTNNTNTSNYLINKYLEENIIKRINHNYYGFVDLSTGFLYANKYLIGSHINDSSFISHHSALEYYGFYNQVYNEVYVSSLSRFKEFSFDDYSYKYLSTKTDLEIQVINDMRISTIERAIVDSIKDIDKVSDIEEIIKSINLIKYIDENKIISYLDLLNQKILYKKIGFVLGYFKDLFKLNDSFFNILKDKGSNVRGYFSNIDKEQQVYNKEWQIYTHKNEYIISIINKGDGY